MALSTVVLRFRPVESPTTYCAIVIGDDILPTTIPPPPMVAP